LISSPTFCPTSETNPVASGSLVSGGRRFLVTFRSLERTQGWRLGILVPDAYQGAGLDHLSFAIFVEEVARFSASTAGILDVHGSVGTEPIVLHCDAGSGGVYFMMAL